MPISRRISCSRNSARTTRLVLVDRDKNEQKSPAYLRLNPAGRIPVLVDGELVLYESAAICLHLADRHAAAGLRPRPAATTRAVLQVAHLPHQHGAGRTAALLLSGAPGRRCRRGGADQGACRAPHRRDARPDRGRARRRPRPVPVGCSVSRRRCLSADAVPLDANMQHPARARPHLARLLEAVMARPATQRAFAAEGIAAPFY